MLWSDGAGFAQVIEGDPDNVELTMDRIRSDRRHTDIDVVLDRDFLSRQFGNWSMRRAGKDAVGTQGTAFLLGFALSQSTAAARRLYDVVFASGA
jgi:hypothetical protein